MSMTPNSSSSDTCGFNGGITTAHTIAAGVGRILVANVAMNASATTSGKITGATFNGVAMTLAKFDSYAISANWQYVYAIPDGLAAGAYSIVYTFNTADVAAEFRNAVFNDGNPASIFTPATSTSNGGQTSPVSMAFTPVAGGIAVVLIGGTGNAEPFVIGAGQTEIGAQTSLIAIRASASWKADATAMSYTWANGARQATFSGIYLNPLTAATPVTINCAVGNCVAAGKTAAITAAGATTITGLVGNATASGALATIKNYIQSFPMCFNNRTPRPGVSAAWSFFPGGRFGALVGITPVEGVAVSDSAGRVQTTANRVPGVLVMAVLGADASADDTYVQGF